MGEVKIAAGRLKPGNVGRDPHDARHSDTRVRVTNYFIAINVVLDDGKLGLLSLTPYFHTAAAAEREAVEIRKDYPKADVLWTTTVYDVDDAAQLDELRSVIEQTAAEQEQENYQ
jgi:hypothetical protein